MVEIKPPDFTFTADRDKFAFALSPEMPLSWAGFGFETGLLWFLGRGVFRFQLDRYLAPQVHNFTVQPLEVRRGLVWSNIVTLKYLHAQKLFPRTLVSPFKESGDRAETVFRLHNKPEFLDQTLGYIAYGLADLTVDFFKRGAKTIRAQCSVEYTEFWADVGMSQTDIANLLNPKVKDYEDHETVSALL